MHVEYHDVMQDVISKMDARFGGGRNPPVGPLPVPPQQKVTLQQVMALCVEVEDRNNTKAVTPVTVNATVIEKCHYRTARSLVIESESVAGRKERVSRLLRTLRVDLLHNPHDLLHNRRL